MIVIIATVLTVLFGVVGWALKSLIWNSSNVPKKATDHGRKISGYFLFISVLVSSHNLLTKDLDEALIASLVTSTAFAIVGFVVGFIYGFLSPIINTSKKQEIAELDHSISIQSAINSKADLMTDPQEKHISNLEMKNMPVGLDDETIWAMALEELESKNRKLGIWAKAFSESNGDENQAKAMYLRIRFDEINRTKASGDPVPTSEAISVLSQSSNELDTKEESSDERRVRLVANLRKSTRYEDAVALLEDIGFEIKVRSTGLLSPAEYEIWDKEQNTMIFKAISKGKLLQYTVMRFVFNVN
jgi:hypothetical protein